MKPSSKPPAVKLFIVDDSELVRTGLRTLLGTERAIQIVGEAANVASAVTHAQRLKPEVVLMDIRLPDGSGFDACRQILQFLPETRVLFLTSVVDDHLVDEAIRCGGHGYLLKEIDGRGLVHAIFDVAAGKSILDPAVTARVMKLLKTGSNQPNLLDTLSPQERRVLALIAEGKTNKEVGLEMTLSEKTVKNYLANIFDKLNVTRRSHAAALYAQKPTS
ncbi:MAG: response regulator transcription factor [Verrucomicrobia bacterium]|nr:response regulator transcription factor [Verrucomicrobiota bacterium]